MGLSAFSNFTRENLDLTFRTERCTQAFADKGNAANQQNNPMEATIECVRKDGLKLTKMQMRFKKIELFRRAILFGNGKVRNCWRPEISKKLKKTAEDFSDYSFTTETISRVLPKKNEQETGF